MKNNFLLGTILITSFCFAQNNYPSDGNVGLGTNTPLSKLSVSGSLTIDGGLTNSSVRPLISSGTLLNGEIRGYSNSGNLYDDGFLRLSAGGGTNSNVKSYIDLSGFSNLPDMNRNITFGTLGQERMRIDMSGNIGIGTTAPNSKLTIRSGTTGVSIHPGSGANSYFGCIGFNREAATGEIFDNRAYAFQINNGNNIYDKSLHFQIYSGDGGHINTNALVINGATGGNVGIGLSEPSALLDIYSPLPLIGSYDTQKWSTSNADYNLKLQTIWNYSGINQEFIQRFNGVDYKSLVFYQGNIGIGISNPTNKLDVNGTIHSKEVKVDLKDWPDYVFKKEYDLPTLKEVEKHITEKGHLQNIPSEEEVLKNGINLGEMNAKLLQKIEELTLYVIKQDKMSEELKLYVMEQNKRLDELEAENKKLRKN